MRALVVLLLAVAAGACGTQDPGQAPPLARIVVRVDRDGPKGPEPARELRLTCRAPDESGACGAAAGVSDADLAPTPADLACTQVYGGPQTASITGFLRGRDVSARFSRANGCEIARWDRVQDLLADVP